MYSLMGEFILPTYVLADSNPGEVGGRGRKEGGERAERPERSQSAKVYAILQFRRFKQCDVAAKCVDAS